MRFEFFHIPSSMPAAAAEAPNQFVATHRVINVDKHFSDDDSGGFWSFCVTWLDQTSAGDKAKAKVDYKKVLTESQFAVYSQLRELRKQLAEDDGTPVYAVATNEQLAEIVRRPVSSLTGLERIAGFGKGKIERHGPAIVNLMKSKIELLQGADQEGSSAKSGSAE